MDGQWFAKLYADGQEHGRPLVPSSDDLSVQLSDHAIRAGFIAVGEWLVRTGRFANYSQSDQIYAARKRAA